MLIDLQRAVAAAALGEDWRPAAALLRPDIPADRLIVYRNTVLGGLAEVLAAAYPSVVRVLGDETFQRAGRGFAAHRPPDQPQMWRYGEGFAEFLEVQPAGRVPPWLPDLARLDRAMHEAYFAADADALDPARLAELAPSEGLFGARVAFHPSVRLVASAWPVHTLWRRARAGHPVPAAEMAPPETVLVARPGLEVLCRRLEPLPAAFVAALVDGGTLGEAAAVLPAEDAAAVVQEELARLLRAGLIAGFDPTPRSQGAAVPEE